MGGVKYDLDSIFAKSHMTKYSKYARIKPLLRNLISDVIQIASFRWRIEWGYKKPSMGTHYYYNEIEQLDSFKSVKSELLKFPNIQSKYFQDEIEKPIFSFVKIVIASLQSPEGLDYAIEDWWEDFCEFFEKTSADIRLLVGLSNFYSDKVEYQLNNETKLRFFGHETLGYEIYNLVPKWDEIGIPQDFPLSRCNGVIEVNFLMPAKESVLTGQYTNECIERMILLRDAIQLCGFGYIGVEPWIAILNPSLPMDDVVAVGKESRYLSALEMPKLVVNQEVWDRFTNIHEILMQLHANDKKEIEKDRFVRKRFRTAISRFHQTFEKGLWEETIVDLVILMESLLTPNKQGGRMQLALAASNLLGTTDEDSREVYDNVNRLYSIRNDFVHGEPITQEKWEGRLLDISLGAGKRSQNNLDNQGIKEYAIEIARDYARRSISSMLNLYYHAQLSPSDSLTKDLHKMHLDKNLKTKIQAAAHCYSFLDRNY